MSATWPRPPPPEPPRCSGAPGAFPQPLCGADGRGRALLLSSCISELLFTFSACCLVCKCPEFSRACMRVCVCVCVQVRIPSLRGSGNPFSPPALFQIGFSAGQRHFAKLGLSRQHKQEKAKYVLVWSPRSRLLQLLCMEGQFMGRKDHFRRNCVLCFVRVF